MQNYKNLKCTKCGKIIGDGEGFYNIPSGVKCSNCGSRPKDRKKAGEELILLLKKYGAKSNQS